MTDEQYDATEEGSGAKQMRETIKRKDDTIADLEAKLASFQDKEMDSTVKNIGLDPSTGFGKALKQVYKGDINNEALLEFAKQEYGYEAEGVTAQETPQPAQETAVQSDARARVEGRRKNLDPFTNFFMGYSAEDFNGLLLLFQKVKLVMKLKNL